jgi:pimeloyl-ACP methyl ester carboxylesterase
MYGMPLLEAAKSAGLRVKSPAEPTDEEVSIDGFKFHYLDWGNNHLPHLLFIHGFAQQAHSFDFAALGLRDRFHVISVDLRGHGDTDWSPDGSYLLSEYVADIAAFIDVLGLNDLSICGLSLGGRVTFIYAADHSSVVRSIVVVDAAPDLNLTGSSRIRDFVTGQDEWDSFDDLVNHVAGYTQKLRPMEQIRGSVRRAAKELPDGRWTWKYDKVLRQPRPKDPTFTTEYLWTFMDRITCPMLLVRGAKSDVLTPEAAQAVLDRVSTAELAVVEKAAHLVPGDNPAGFADAVNPFFNKVLDGQAEVS